jgi:hypothetical protein
MSNTNENFHMGRSTCALAAYLFFTIGVMTLESCSMIPLPDPSGTSNYDSGMITKSCLKCP